jgi:hypothetical protein
MTAFVNLPFETGGAVDATKLDNTAAREFALTAAGLQFVGLVECLSSTPGSKREVVTVEVEVERPQRLRHPIQRVERLAVVFSGDPNVIPRVLALREDFPSVPHLNLEPYELPKSLCLYEGDPREIMLRLTPIQLIERIREWLALTARGELHQSDQPLEPFLLDSAGSIILPDKAFSNLTSGGNTAIIVEKVSREDSFPWILVGHPIDQANEGREIPFLAMGFRGKPTTHGIVRRQPKYLSELVDLLNDSGFDLLTEIRKRLMELNRDKTSFEQRKNAKLVLFISIPKIREDGEPCETSENWAYVSGCDITVLGSEVGIWEKHDGVIGGIFPWDKSKIGQAVELLPIRVVRSFSREMASLLSGLDSPDERRIVQVGVGAIGSHLHQNLARAGIGDWTLVDNDRLLPNNVARHALDGRAEGFLKSEYMACVTNNMIDGDPVCHALAADVLAPGDQGEALREEFAQANVIIDASASLGVARYLALDSDSPARRVSAFFTPSGDASVVLAEDPDRTTPLDLLEMQYYREISSNDALREHLSIEGDPIRYGQSCRDVTSRIPQDIVSLHAALASNRIKQILSDSTASACIWSLDRESGAVTPHHIPTSPMETFTCGPWRVRTDKWFRQRLADLRSGKLPNETGGILLGSHDMRRKILYLVDTIPSPPDSKEWPTVYIRGRKGLEGQVKDVEKRTAGNLSYVGEWHSHPDGASTRPSHDDQKAFEWLSQHMSQAGLPALMMIVGQQGNAIYIGTMAP